MSIANETAMKTFLNGLPGSSSTYFYFEVKSIQTGHLFFRKLVSHDRLFREIQRAIPYRGYSLEGVSVPIETIGFFIAPEARAVEVASAESCANCILDNFSLDLSNEYYLECLKNPLNRQILDVELVKTGDDEDILARFLKAYLLLKDAKACLRVILETKSSYRLLCYDLPRHLTKPMFDLCQGLGGKEGKIHLRKNELIPIPGMISEGFEVKLLSYV